MRFNRRARLTKPSDEVRPPASSVGSAKRGGGGGRSRKAKSHDEDSNNVPKENMLVCNNSTGSGGGSSSDEGVAEVHSSSSNSGRCREISIPKSLLANADLKDLGNNFETIGRKNIDSVIILNLYYLQPSRWRESLLLQQAR